MSMHRCMNGFVGPADIFRNPEAIFRFFEPGQKGKIIANMLFLPSMTLILGNHDSPFDIVLSHSGKDFAVMGMHFKLGLYEHQSAGALQGCGIEKKKPLFFRLNFFRNFKSFPGIASPCRNSRYNQVN
jgi:2-methylcitrate dehydratase